MEKTFRDFKSLLILSAEYERQNKKNLNQELNRLDHERKLITSTGETFKSELHKWKVK